MAYPLYVGAAKEKITPPEEYLPYMRGLLGSKFAAIHDDLYVRAVAFKAGEETALVIGFDLDKAPYPAKNMEAIEEKYGIKEQNILYYGIHTHSAPTLGSRPGEMGNQDRDNDPEVKEHLAKYEDYVNVKVLEAVDTALASLRRAHIGHAKTPSYHNVNRVASFFSVNDQGEVSEIVSEGINAGGPTDKNAYVLAAYDEDEKPIAIICNYAMHNTIMFRNNVDGKGSMAVSGDLGGNISQTFEKRFPGVVALWCSGPAGDVNPLRPNVHVRPDPGAANPEYLQKVEILRQMVADHYADLLCAYESIDLTQSAVTIGGAVRWVKVPGREILRDPDDRRKVLGFRTGDDVPPYEIRLHLLRIGDYCYCGIGGELFTTHAFAIQDAVPLKDVVVVNHDASMIKDAGYILDDDSYERTSRNPEGARSIPGVPPRFQKGYVRDALARNAREMFEELY